MTNLQNKARIANMDVLKAIGIICVLIGHLCALSPIRIFIYSFHMPLFFLVSGYFLKINVKLSSFLYKSIKRLITPYLVTCLVMLLVNMFFGGISTNSLSNHLMRSVYGIPSDMVPGQHFGISRIGPIWFLLALFWSQMIVVIISRIHSIMMRGFIVLFLAIIATIVGYHIWMPFALLNGMVASVFVYIGSMVRGSNVQEYISTKKVVVISLLIWMICVICDNTMEMHFSISIFQFPLYGFDFVGAICAIIVLYNLCRWLSGTVKCITTILSHIGRSTLEILCVHAVDIETVQWS